MTEQAETTPTTYELPSWDDELTALMEEKLSLETDEVEGFVSGAIVEGTVQEVGTDTVYVNLGDDVFGRCDVEDARPVGAEAPDLESGAQIRVLLEQEIDESRWEVSIGKVEHLDLYDRFVQLAKDKGRVSGTILLVVRGGFAVEVEGLRCFLPGRESGIRFHEAFESIGREMEFDVIRFDRKRGQPVLSRKELAREERKAQVEALMAQLAIGDRREGMVTAVKPYGAFVDIGGIEGLLHVSEMSAGHVENPNELLKKGDTTEVVIVELNRRQWPHRALPPRDRRRKDRRADRGIGRRLRGDRQGRAARGLWRVHRGH